MAEDANCSAGVLGVAAPPALAAESASPLLPVLGSGGAVPVPVLAPAVPARGEWLEALLVPDLREQ